LVCSPLFSVSNWIRWLTPRAIVGVDLVCIGGRWFWLWGPFPRWLRKTFHECECLLRSVELGLIFDMLASLFGLELDPVADSARHRRCRFHVHRWAMIFTLRPLYSVSTPNISQVWVSIVNGLTRAFIWYARLYFQCRIGSDGWLRVPSSASFSCASVGDDFDFEAPLLGEYAKYFTSVNVYCEGLSQGFLLICLPLFSESNWIVKMTPRAIVGVVFVYIGGRWFWLLGPFTRWVRQIFHKCECLLWRVKLELSFDMLASIFRVELVWGYYSACLRRSQFRVHRWAMISTLRPLHSVSTPDIQDVLMCIVKG
jgi:hypothetical protein